MDCSGVKPLVFIIFLLFFVTQFSRTTSDVIFPTDDEEEPRRQRSRQQGRSRVIRKPEAPIAGCSTEETFCEDVANYPSSQVEMAVESDAKAAQFIRDNFEGLDPSISGRKRPTLADRTERRVCEVSRRTVYPKAGRTTDNKWKYIVNTGKTYKQGIVVEMCSYQDSECQHCTALKSRCGQTFVEKNLLTFDEHNFTVVDSFEFPGSCVCYVTDITNT